jgi:hypothetical protein
MCLKVAGLVVQRRAERSVYPVQPKLFFEVARQRLIGVDGFVGMMDLQRLRVDLVHGDVKMLMLLLTMADRDVLVPLEPSRPHRPANDILKLPRGQAPVLWVKRNHEMVALLSLGSLGVMITWPRLPEVAHGALNQQLGQVAATIKYPQEHHLTTAHSKQDTVLTHEHFAIGLEPFSAKLRDNPASSGRSRERADGGIELIP